MLEFRRELRIEVAGLITGPRATGWWIASFGEGLALPDAIAAAVPSGHRIIERNDLAFAAGTFGSPLQAGPKSPAGLS